MIAERQLIAELQLRQAGDVDPVAGWFHSRFWPELLRIHKQALTVVTLIAEQKQEPAGLSDRLIDPQPLLLELAHLPGAGGSLLALHAREYLLAWQGVRRVAITRRPVRNGGQLFDVMTASACYFADQALASKECRSVRVL